MYYSFFLCKIYISDGACLEVERSCVSTSSDIKHLGVQIGNHVGDKGCFLLFWMKTERTNLSLSLLKSNKSFFNLSDICMGYIFDRFG